MEEGKAKEHALEGMVFGTPIQEVRVGDWVRHVGTEQACDGTGAGIQMLAASLPDFNVL